MGTFPIQCEQLFDGFHFPGWVTEFVCGKTIEREWDTASLPFHGRVEKMGAREKGKRRTEKLEEKNN
jgi:hypothetical protein